MAGLLDEIPGYKEAVDYERKVREASFYPMNETICGIDVLPLTPIHISYLNMVESPFLKHAKADENDVGLFLWIVSPDFKPCECKRDPCECKAIKEHTAIVGEFITRYGVEHLIQGIEEYLFQTFMDSAEGGSSTKVPYTCEQADIAYVFAKEFGWDDDQTLSKPLKRLFQYMKRIRAANNPGAILKNWSDNIRQRYIDAENEKIEACKSKA